MKKTPKKKTPNPDMFVIVYDHRTVFLFQGIGPQFAEWVDEHIDRDEAQFFGADTLVVGHRYVATIRDALLNDGFVLEYR